MMNWARVDYTTHFYLTLSQTIQGRLGYRRTVRSIHVLLLLLSLEISFGVNKIILWFDDPSRAYMSGVLLKGFKFLIM